jgi:hypothetical protein
MRRPVLALLLLAALIVPHRSAHATPAAYDFSKALRALAGSVKVPPEWDGVWTTQDSVYDCTTGFQALEVGADTLCSGEVFTQAAIASPLTLDCNATADATTFHATCSGSADVMTGCTLTVGIQIDAIRTSSSYRAVTTTDMGYAGSATGCDQLPASCTRTVTYGTRTGPAPSDFCVTPAKRTTWGQLKVSYR